MADRGLKRKLINYRQDFMLLLIEKYKEYLRDKNPVPQEIIDFTRKYRESGDMFLDYLKERTMKAKTPIHQVTLYQDFLLWFAENYPGKTPPSQVMFGKGLKRHHNIKDRKINGSTSKPAIENLKLIPLENDGVVDV